MPVSKPGVIDAIGVDRPTGMVVLSMFEEREWTAVSLQLQDLERKVKCYLDFIQSGQINETLDFRGKPLKIELYCQFQPPEQLAPALAALKAHLQQYQIAFEVLVRLRGAVEFKFESIITEG
jgi:hypothetical protein